MVQAQTITPGATATSSVSSTDLQIQYQQLLIQLINLLIQQVKDLQAQLAAMQTQQNEIKAVVVPPAAAAPVPQPSAALPADEYPVISFLVDGSSAENTDVSAGPHKIEWLAVQKNKHEMTCSSPEIGKIGTQGVMQRELAMGANTWNFTCRDNITLVETTKTLTLRVVQ